MSEATAPGNHGLAVVVSGVHDHPAASRGFGLDVRTVLTGFVIVQVLSLSLADITGAFVCAVVVLAAIASLHRPGLLLGAVAVQTVSAGLFLLSWLPLNGALWGSLISIGFWVFRFAVAVFAAAYVVLTVTPGELITALYRARVPRQLAVPVTVMLRFLPQARQEVRAIIEAMSLRGIPLGAGAWLRHPLHTIEFLLVPMLVSISRLADDLTASGLVRGLGGPQRPTPLIVSRFSWRDAAALVVVCALIGLTAWLRAGGS